jgi:hypothetical protein
VTERIASVSNGSPGADSESQNKENAGSSQVCKAKSKPQEQPAKKTGADNVFSVDHWP